jgi:hypothetical protein
MMIQNLINKSFNIFDFDELNEFYRIFHAFFALISSFRRFLSLHFNRFLMIVTTLRLFILNLRSFSKMIKTTEIETTAFETELINSTFSISTKCQRFMKISWSLISLCHVWYSKESFNRVISNKEIILISSSNMMKQWRRERLFKRDWRRFTNF